MSAWGSAGSQTMGLIMDMTNITRLADRKYQIRFKYRDPLTGKQRIFKRRITGTLDEARALRDEAKAAVRRDDFGQQARSKTLRHYRSSFAKARSTRRGWQVSKATRARDGHALKDHILPVIGDWLVTEITLADLEEVVDEWLEKTDSAGERYQHATINVWIKVARIYIRYACKMEGISSPADDLSYLTVGRSQVGVALTPAQTAAFLAEMRRTYPQWYAMCVLGFLTGLRFSTLSALRWEDVDTTADVIRFVHSQYRGVRKEADKTGKRIRVPLIGPLKAVLQWHRMQLIEVQHPGLSTGLVFPSQVPDGVQNGHLSASALRKVMTAACKTVRRELAKASPTAAPFPHITPHDMRRTWSTLMNEARVDRHVIGAIAGHSTDEMLFHYDHVSDERKAQPLRALANELGLT